MSTKSVNKTRKKYRQAGMSLAQAERSAAAETSGSFGLVAVAAGLFIGASALAGIMIYAMSPAQTMTPTQTAAPTQAMASIQTPLVPAPETQASLPTDIPALTTSDVQASLPEAAPSADIDTATILRNITDSIAVETSEVEAQTSQTLMSILDAKKVECISLVRTQASALTILFGPSGVDPIGDSLARAGALAEAVDTCDGVRLMVEGHTDSTGDAVTNLSLSWERADAIIAAIAQAGHPTTKLEPIGFGDRHRITQGSDTNDDNRRVSFRIEAVDQ